MDMLSSDIPLDMIYYVTVYCLLGIIYCEVFEKHFFKICISPEVF